MAISAARCDIIKLMADHGVKPPALPDIWCGGVCPPMGRCKCDRYSRIFLDFASVELSIWDLIGCPSISPVHAAAVATKPKVARLLLGLGFIPCRLSFAHVAMFGDAPLARRYLCSRCMLYALHKAIKGGDTRSVEILLEAGADIHEQVKLDRFQGEMDALQRAVGIGDTVMIDFLLARGANPNAEAGGFLTALQVAAVKGHLGIARHLISLGAEVNARGNENNGLTALESAAWLGRLDMVCFLLASGAGTRGRHLAQYLRAILFSRKRGHYALSEYLVDFRQWTAEERMVCSLVESLRFRRDYVLVSDIVRMHEEGVPETDLAKYVEQWLASISRKIRSETSFEETDVDCECEMACSEYGEDEGHTQKTVGDARMKAVENETQEAVELDAGVRRGSEPPEDAVDTSSGRVDGWMDEFVDWQGNC